MAAQFSMFRDPFGTDNAAVDQGDSAEGGSFVPHIGRRTSVSAESLTPAYATIAEERARARESHNQPPKTDSQVQRIRAAIGNNVLFRSLDAEQYNEVLQAMREVKVLPDHIVIKQGDQGDYFYVVESGSLDVYIADSSVSPAEALAAPADQLGVKVLTYGSGSSFGELALLYMQPRAASIKSTSDCTLWALDRLTFRSILVQTNYHRRTLYDQLLQHVPLLTLLSDADRLRVSDAIELETISPNSVIFREGSVGTHFYLIVNGAAEVRKENNDQPLATLVQGSYFGELALLDNKTRAATVVATKDGPLQVAKLDADAFTRLLGPLADIMRNHARENYGQAIVPTDTVQSTYSSAPPSNTPEAGDPLSQSS